jgi:hypothetical protein
MIQRKKSGKSSLAPLDDWDQPSVVETPVKKKKREKTGESEFPAHLFNDGRSKIID